MKKIINVLSVLMAAATLLCFAACSNPSSSGPGDGSGAGSGSGAGAGSNTNLSSSYSEPIFNSSETTEPVMSLSGITFEDGEWIYQEIQTGTNWKSSNYAEVTVSENGSKFTFTKYYQWDSKQGALDVTAIMKNYEDVMAMSLKYTFNKTNSAKTKYYRHDKESDDETKGIYVCDTYFMKK